MSGAIAGFIVGTVFGINCGVTIVALLMAADDDRDR